MVSPGSAPGRGTENSIVSPDFLPVIITPGGAAPGFYGPGGMPEVIIADPAIIFGDSWKTQTLQPGTP